jgi:hypothetical protein
MKGTEMSGRTLQPITFKVDEPLVSSYEADAAFRVYHAYPRVSEWPAGKVSDAINPRSHEEGVLDSPVAKAIRETLRRDPENFVLMNRGILLLADSVDEAAGTVRVSFGGDPRLRGLADGGTTDACLLADMLGAFKSHREKARVHVEIVVELNDPDRIAKLVEGRNTSRQVRSASLANAAGRFDWLKAALPEEVAARIAWEENSPGVPVSEVLGLVGLFRPSPRSLREDDEKFSDYEWGKACVTMYRDRSKLAADLRQPSVLEEYQSLAPFVTPILQLHDEVWVALAAQAQARLDKTRSAAKAAKLEKMFPAEPSKTTYFGLQAARRTPEGWLFPAVAAAAQFIRDGSWVVGLDQIKKWVAVAISEQVFMYADSTSVHMDIKPDKFAKSHLNYCHLEGNAWLEAIEDGVKLPRR